MRPDFPRVPQTVPAPAEMQNVIRRMTQMHDELRPLRLTSRPQMQARFGGKTVRVVGSALHFRPEKETFHDFIENHLLWTLGKAWFDNEIREPPEERHIVLRWRAERFEQIRKARREKKAPFGPVGFVPSGNVQALLVLADDVYQLKHALKVPRQVVQRLRDTRQFQGARYEILAASVVARCGFKIEFIDDKTRKMPEFYAVKKEDAAVKIAVEAKSRHRRGVLHEPPNTVGSPAPPMRADVRRLFKEALQQNPGDVPFFIFIDLNLPITKQTSEPGEAQFRELKRLFDELRTGTPDTPDDFTGVFFTNFGWHYYREKAAQGGQYISVRPLYPRYPVSDQTWNLLTRALDEYGFIPDEEQHEKEVRTRFPELK